MLYDIIRKVIFSWAMISRVSTIWPALEYFGWKEQKCIAFKSLQPCDHHDGFHENTLTGACV